MLPKILMFDSYSLMMLLGIVGALVVFYVHHKKRSDSKYILDILIVACVAIAFGILGATLLQYLFDLLKGGNPRLSMTFYGGLIFGVGSFIIMYMFFVKKTHPEKGIIDNVYVIAPACITTAHGIGRIGCFLSGCCYGKETDSVFGVLFPGMENPVYPTQLFEAAFLLILSSILFLLAYKKESIITMPLYLISYGVFRFLIEFIRGDDRGAFILSMSPSQFISIFVVIAGIVLIFTVKKKTKKTEQQSNEQQTD